MCIMRIHIYCFYLVFISCLYLPEKMENEPEEVEEVPEEREGPELKLDPEFIATNVPDMYLDEDGNMRRFKKTQDVSNKGWTMWAYGWSQYAYFLVTSPFFPKAKKNDEEQKEGEDV